MKEIDWEKIGTSSLVKSTYNSNLSYRKDSRTLEEFKSIISKSRKDELEAADAFIKSYERNYFKYKTLETNWKPPYIPQQLWLEINIPYSAGEVNESNHKNEGDATICYADGKEDIYPKTIPIEIKAKVKYNPDRMYCFYFKQDSLKSTIKRRMSTIAILNTGTEDHDLHICSLMTVDDLIKIQSGTPIKLEHHGNKLSYEVDVRDFNWFNLHSLEPFGSFVLSFNRFLKESQK